jgi:hypothetical protein
LISAATVLAFAGIGSLPLRLWHALLAVAIALAAGRALGAVPNDHDLLRRQVTLWLPLAIALAMWTATVVARLHPARGSLRHIAAALVAVAVGYGGAVTLGVDGAVARDFRGYNDARVTELARCTPQRFVLLGGFALDESLVLSDQREIYFVNPGMNPPGDGARALTDAAMRERGWPAFIIEDTPDGPWNFNWPGFAIRRVPGCPRIREIVRRGAP